MFGPFSLDMPYISITNPFPTHFLTYKNTKTAVCYDSKECLVLFVSDINIKPPAP